MGIVLYSGEDTLPFGENMFAVPTASLWEGLNKCHAKEEH